MDAGTYEVLRGRLAQQATELAGRAETLNSERLKVFGGTELRLVGTERIRTEHNCVPRDIVSVGGFMLFGYNVFIGLKSETTVDDVFSLHTFVRSTTGKQGARDGEAFGFEAADNGPLRDPAFLRAFGEMYRYYRDTRLLQLRRLEGRLLAVFQTGVRVEDVRVLRWKVDTDGAVSFMDDRGERDHVFPPSHDFEWVETTRDQHVLGRHPHISIGDEVFVETIGGNLTIKVENNTEIRCGCLRGARRRAVAEPGRRRHPVRAGRLADSAADPALQGDPAPAPGLQHAYQRGCPPGRDRAGLPAAAGGPGHHLPRRLLPGDGCRRRRSTPMWRASSSTG